MKKFILALTALLCLTISVQAMSYEQARQQALFLTDKMAYELNLTDEQYEAAYEINLDYLMGVNTIDDLYGPYWQQRNLDLIYVLLSWQYRAFCDATYFYRPLYWNAGYWHFGIYARYPHRDYFFFGRPHFYIEYRGGHSWRMNGGRSWYHGRDFRPRPGHDGPHHGMRDGFQRGDFGNGFQGNPNSATSFGTARRPPMMGTPAGQVGNRANNRNNSSPSNRQGNAPTFGNRSENRQPSRNGSGFTLGRRESSTRSTVTRSDTPSSTTFGSRRGGNTSSTMPRNTFTPNSSNTGSGRNQIFTSPRNNVSSPSVNRSERSTPSFGSRRGGSPSVGGGNANSGRSTIGSGRMGRR